jgi:nitrate/nitrite transporter NarK
MGNVGGFAGPFLVGWIRDTTGSFVNALLMLAAVMAIPALMLPLGGRRLSLGRVPPDVQEPETAVYRPIV